MKRLCTALLAGLVGGLGCVAPAERLDVPPVPLDAASMDYRQVLTRARLQATGATEAFYLDNWAKLEQAASSLEQTARLLPTSDGVPEAKRQDFEAAAGELAGFAQELGETARQKDVEGSTQRLQQIGLRIRSLQIQY